MAIFLTWNVYHGTFQNGPYPSPSDRIARIVALGMQQFVDVICLQEVPRSILDPAVPLGTPGALTPIVQSLDATVAGWSTFYNAVQVYSENNPNGNNWVTTTDGYLVLHRPATFPNIANLGYTQPGAFVDLIGNSLRPPVQLDLSTMAGTVVTVLDWHADTGGPQVAIALSALDHVLGQANGRPNRTIVLGDLNYPGPVENSVPNHPFPGWEDLSVRIDRRVNGVDHVLSSETTTIALTGKLNFKSDANHYPIAVNMAVAP
ncbi:endonuclease/exonuclease/phosphatase family protein [Actinokineospora inagensis]|uniref:endonuclease/exonuclease/phosphatase family protein n=1 Tax=Actinokineospora inagensis TaxID=103730 RepID=UPI0004127BA2|nr:endonuclease/exonuclease/phosphatase family protein [Actinokineospora inagensis]